MITLPEVTFDELGFRSNVVDRLVEGFIKTLNSRPDVIWSTCKGEYLPESILLEILSGNHRLYYILRQRGSEMISQAFVQDLDKIVGNIEHLLVGRKERIIERLKTARSRGSNLHLCDSLPEA